jgi:hypothetical protein
MRTCGRWNPPSPSRCARASDLARESSALEVRIYGSGANVFPSTSAGTGIPKSWRMVGKRS